jgi:homogentisate phytyltransferase / homogentisate geranylgeranyltransferase
MWKKLKILWQFSRPHTIIGSLFSITALYCIALAGGNFLEHIGLYVQTLIAALTCNIFIVGLNQIIDKKLDEINKPYLPLAAKSLSSKNAYTIIYVALAICIIMALLTSFFLSLLILAILAIGIAYSTPPLQLKKHHLPAALAITIVRGFLVNVGMFYHFNSLINNGKNIPEYIWCLTIFIMAFSIAIAWFKDLPDTQGDTTFNIKTFPILYSKKIAFIGGSSLVIAAYIAMLIWGYTSLYHPSQFFIFAHWLLLLLFIANIYTVTLSDQLSIKQFYLRFWGFFFAEYLLFIIWIYLR